MSSIPFRREIAEAIAELFAWDASPLWGEHRASIPYRELLSQLGERGYPRVSSDGAISKLIADGDLKWDSMQVWQADGTDELKSYRIHSIRATSSLWRWLPGESELETPTSSGEARSDQIRLPWEKVEGYLFDALLKAHDYDFDEGKVIRYDRQVDANRVVQEIQKEYLVDDEKAKQAVYDAFRRRFPAPAGWNTKPGKKTYDAMCKEQTPLLHWFLRQTGQDRSERVGEARTIGDMSDVQGRKLVR